MSKETPMSNERPGDRSSGFTYSCPRCPFQSIGWPTAAVAAARGAQHDAEHESGQPMPELADFDPQGA